MDTGKQTESRDGTTTAQKAPPVLTAGDVAALEAMCGDVAGYFYKMLDYMDQRVRDGVRRGEFTEEQARADLDLALWYAYACNNVDDYDYYYKAAMWMPASEPAARAARSGIWFYRYACALMYCGRLEEARQAVETGVALDPDYPWGWLEAGKLRAHFGDRDGALAAVRRGLELVPGDYEFTTLRREILEGRSLEEMEFHWIDPNADQTLQAGEDAGEFDKRMAIAGICCDPENLAAIKEALAPTEWEADAPYCTFRLPYQDGSLLGRFFMNEAALSKFPLPWVRELVRRLPELERRGPDLPDRPGGPGHGGAVPGVVRSPAGPGAAAELQPGTGSAAGPLRQGFLPLQGRSAHPGPPGGRRLPGLRPAGGTHLGPGSVPPGPAGWVWDPLSHRGGGGCGRRQRPDLRNGRAAGGAAPVPLPRSPRRGRGKRRPQLPVV